MPLSQTSEEGTTTWLVAPPPREAHGNGEAEGRAMGRDNGRGTFCAPHPIARALLPLGTCRNLVSEPASPQLGWQCLQLARGRGHNFYLYSLSLALHYFVGLSMCLCPTHLLQEALPGYRPWPFLLFLQAQTHPFSTAFSLSPSLLSTAYWPVFFKNPLGPGQPF